MALLLACPAAADEARRRAAQAAALSTDAAVTGDPAAARDRAAAAFTGTETEPGGAVDGRGVPTGGRMRLAAPAPWERDERPAPPGPEAGGMRRGLSTGLVLAGGAALGALQGFLSAGPVGALAGGVLGLGAAWLYTKGQPAAAFGATAGGIIGSFFGGPLGGLVGAGLGAVLGWGLGKLFGL